MLLLTSSGHFLSSTNSPAERERENGINLKPESESEDPTKETHAVRMKSKRMKRRFAVRKCNNGHGRAEQSQASEEYVAPFSLTQLCAFSYVNKITFTTLLRKLTQVKIYLRTSFFSFDLKFQSILLLLYLLT